MSRGLLLGQFMPLHRGHVMLCEFASAYCDHLTILVCTLPDDPIPGPLRVQWMTEMFPKARVVHVIQPVLEDNSGPDAWAAWRKVIKDTHPEPLDYVFASESYGTRLAAETGARFVPFDPDRIAVPHINADIVRENPYAAWKFLPAPVRAHYVKTVCLFGPESTGKSTLSPLLARSFDTTETPEYGRTYCVEFGTDCTAQDLLDIARGQAALEYTARRHANRLLIVDTDRLMTAVWAQMLLGTKIAALEDSPAADFYLLCGIDVPWEDDGTRYFPDSERRRRFYDLCVETLESRKLPYVLLPAGTEARLRKARAAILAQFPQLAAP